jgi:hypothetical protein
MSAESKRRVPWHEAFANDPFVVLCCRFASGEQFMIAPADPEKSATLEAMGLLVAAFVTETDLRGRLTRAGLSEWDTTARIQLAREWATTLSHAG